MQLNDGGNRRSASWALLLLSGCGGSDDSSNTGMMSLPKASPTASTSGTINPLVARISVSGAPSASIISGEFGSDTNYGKSTSRVTANSAGAASILVAGMRPNATYHMRAKVTGSDGSIAYTPDSSFTTGSPPAALASLNLKVETAPGRTPSPGVELIDSVNGPEYPYVVDLSGKLIWYYSWPDYDQTLSIGGVQQMENGNFVASFSPRSDAPLSGKVDRSKNFVREFDLAGGTVRQLTVTDLNAKLAAKGYSLVLDQFHHHVESLPNGHLLLLSNTVKQMNGFPVQGDVVIDVNERLDPVFVWNSFDHLDVNRHPFDKGDWTHANAVVYSASDGNFLISMRHQHWIIKVNYRNGAGDGSVIWRLGAGGDFKLINGRDPTDWQYAQHFPFFTSTNTAGIFGMILMDNGNSRPQVEGTVCVPAGGTGCYTTIPQFTIDEQARTATVISRVTLPAALYSNFGGNAEVLANGNVEYALSGIPTGGVLQEVTSDEGHALVWSLTSSNGDFIYRGYRLSSLYPGVTWN